MHFVLGYLLYISFKLVTLFRGEMAFQQGEPIGCAVGRQLNEVRRPGFFQSFAFVAIDSSVPSCVDETDCDF